MEFSGLGRNAARRALPRTFRWKSLAIAATAEHYRKFVDARGDELAVLLTANGGRPDMGAMAPKLQQVNVSIVRELQQGMKRVEGTLTPAQWAKVPDKIKYPFGQQPGG